ncbi:hypothetical protein CK203_065518 [Vitis vinifera]|uniref:Uncharacterized protein n=1 Tax=Vitis vinifera TaxID=29760 RepID=A0A438G2S8_VITVI|nr:hypothetical protein CK203_065518 [Vitis vinifera]
MASSHREKTVGKRVTNAGSPPGDSEIERRKCCVAHPGFIDGASSWSVLKRATHAHAPNSLGGKLGLYSSSSKRQCDKRPQLSGAMCARLGPQEPGRPRPPVATTWGTYPDPMVTLWCRTFPHQAVRQAGRNLPNEPPNGSISKRLDNMLSTPFCSHIIHYDPPRGFLMPKFSSTMGPMTPSTISCIVDNS